MFSPPLLDPSCPGQPAASTRGVIAAAARHLAAAGIEAPRLEARALLSAATGQDRERLLADPDRVLTAGEAERFQAMLARRLAREPLAYILGKREFYGRDFLVTPDVLVPRPETETLVEAALRAFPEHGAPLRLLDLGTGSGCLLLTLLALYPRASGVGTDLSPGALAVAGVNAGRLGVARRAELRQASWGEGLEPAFDLVLGNPPYIRHGDLAGLEPDLAYEPAQALDGGADGLAAYRGLTPSLERLLAPHGVALLEIGQGQDGELAPWFAARGFEVRSWPDLAGIARCLELRWTATLAAR